MDELVVFKNKIREQLKENDIIIYKFPREEDEPESQVDVNNNLPFAVVGSNVMIEDDLTGRKFRGRKYPWGCVNIEDEVEKNKNKIQLYSNKICFYHFSVIVTLHYLENFYCANTPKI